MRGKVLSILNNILPGHDFEASNTLVDDGILDSLAVTLIISELTMEFDIDIPFEELESRNFNSVNAIIDLIKRCPKRKELDIL